MKYFYTFIFLLICLRSLNAGTIQVTTNSDSGAGSLRQALADASTGDEIIFSDFVSQITLISEITLGDKSLKINGLVDGSAVSLSGNDSHRIFNINVTNGSSIEILNIDFTNGYNEDSGGAVKVNIEDGTFQISNSSFSNSVSNAGGALYITGAAEVTNCNFTSNRADGYYGEGGGVSAYEGTIFSNCSFVANQAINGGGCFAGNNTVFDHCTFKDNSSSGQGGGVYAYIATIKNSVITGNQSQSQGGGVYCSTASISSVIQCRISDNEAYEGGGIYFSFRGSATQCTITNNTSTSRGGGVYFYSGGTLNNSILWHNTGESKPELYVSGYNTDAMISYCAIEGGYSGEGSAESEGTPITLTDTPFVNEDADDYRLNNNENGGMLCVDKGSDKLMPAGLIYDLDGNTRVDNVVDLGVYEGDYDIATEVDDMVKGRLIVFPKLINSSTQITSETKIERLEIYNANGQCVAIKTPQSLSYTLEMNEYSKGLYLLVIETSTNKFVEKVIKK